MLALGTVFGGAGLRRRDVLDLRRRGSPRELGGSESSVCPPGVKSGATQGPAGTTDYFAGRRLRCLDRFYSDRGRRWQPGGHRPGARHWHVHYFRAAGSTHLLRTRLEFWAWSSLAIAISGPRRNSTVSTTRVPAGGVNPLNWVSPKSSLPNTDLEFYGINSSSQLVGYFTSNTTDPSKAYPYFEDGNYLEHALFTTPGGAVIDLNDMIPANSGWTLLTATGINDQAQIVGYGINPSGALQAYELTPSTVPEPTTLAIFAVMGCACGYRI